MSNARRIIFASTLCSAFTLVPQFVSAADVTIDNLNTNRQSLSTGDSLTITENGEIRLNEGLTFSAISSSGEEIVIDNNGLIENTVGGTGIESGGGGVIITNTGTIKTNAFDSGIKLTGQNATLNNSGTITGTGNNNDVITLYQSGSITNSGEISTSGNGSAGITGYGGSLSIINSGTISATDGGLAIDGGNGDVNLILEANSVINGDIDLGGGVNSLTAIGAMTLDDNIIDAGEFNSQIGEGDKQTFNGDISGANTSLTINGEGKVILTGNNTYTYQTSIEGGATLQIGDGGSTGTLGQGNVQNFGNLIFNRKGELDYAGVISGMGDLIQQGSGTLTLTGDNEYIGNTTINGGTLSISSNSNLGGSSAQLILDGGTLEATADLTISSGRNILLNSGGGNIDTSDNAVTYNGNFASSVGGLTKLGSGTFEHTGVSSYQGDTTIAEGTLKISNFSNGGNYINDGALVITIDAVVSTVMSNGLSGAGSLIKDGDGVLEITSDNKAYTGNTYINNGFLTVHSENSLGVNGAVTVAESGYLALENNLSVGSLAGEGTIFLSANSAGNTIIVGGDDTSTAFNGIIFGIGGGLTKTGEGTLTLAGNNTYTGSTTVNNGLLEVNGSLASIVTVNNGGTLGGRGHLGSVLVSGGSLAPGNSIGTLNSDSVDFSGGGVYEVEVDAAGHTDLLNVDGTAMLTGGSVQVIPEDGDYQPSTDYTILTAGTIEGQFDSVSSTLAFLDPTLSYDANNVFLTLDRNEQSFASVAGTSNQQAVAQTLDTLSQTSNATGLTDNLLLLTAEGANSAYDSLSGVQHSNAQQLQNRAGQQFRGVFSRRMNAPVSFAMGNELTPLATIADVEALPATAAGGINPARGFWIEGMGGQGDIDGDRNAGGVDYDFYGVAGGVDMEVAQDWVAGAAFGYTRTDADIDNGGLDVDSYMAALYGAWQPSAFYLNGNLTFGLHSTDASRQVVVGTFSERAESDYDSVSVQAAVEAGQTLQTTAAGFDVTPFVGLEAFTDSRESFTESGAGVANLDVDRERMESLQSSLGLRFENTWTTESGKTLMPMLQVAWVHEYLDETATLNAGFAAAPGSRFSVEGPELDRNRARVGAGIAAKLSDASQLTMGYQGEFAGSDDNHTVSARFRMEW